MQQDYAQFLGMIDVSLGAVLRQAEDTTQQQRANEVKARINDMIDEAKSKGLADGNVAIFGSFSNGFKSSGSDLDIVYISDDIKPKDLVGSLNLLSGLASKYAFDNVTKIFQANVPILKFTDTKYKMEVDFCINNRLGWRNSILLQSYCEFDERVGQVGRLVKAWVKKKELVGTADGFLNSYAYILLVVYFLQVGLEDPILPNLQLPRVWEGSETQKHLVADNKWGREDTWDCTFWEGDLKDPAFFRDRTDGKLELKRNKMGVAELVFTFFHFYTRVFDWRNEAVSIRLASPCSKKSYEAVTGKSWERHKTGKWDLMQKTLQFQQYKFASKESEAFADLWYIEDPFDLRHNLAGKMTVQGKQRMIKEMERTMRDLSQSGNWLYVCPAEPDDGLGLFFLKIRVSQNISVGMLIKEFEEFDLRRVHVPFQMQGPHQNKPNGGNNRAGGSKNMTAFLEFENSVQRRKAHTKNESYLGDCQLQIHYSGRWALEDTVRYGGVRYAHYDVEAWRAGGQPLLEVDPQRLLPRASERLIARYRDIATAQANLLASSTAALAHLQQQAGGNRNARPEGGAGIGNQQMAVAPGAVGAVGQHPPGTRLRLAEREDSAGQQVVSVTTTRRVPNFTSASHATGVGVVQGKATGPGAAPGGGGKILAGVPHEEYVRTKLQHQAENQKRQQNWSQAGQQQSGSQQRGSQAQAKLNVHPKMAVAFQMQDAPVQMPVYFNRPGEQMPRPPPGLMQPHPAMMGRSAPVSANNVVPGMNGPRARGRQGAPAAANNQMWAAAGNIPTPQQMAAQQQIQMQQQQQQMAQAVTKTRGQAVPPGAFIVPAGANGPTATQAGAASSSALMMIRQQAQMHMQQQAASPQQHLDGAGVAMPAANPIPYPSTSHGPSVQYFEGTHMQLPRTSSTAASASPSSSSPPGRTVAPIAAAAMHMQGASPKPRHYMQQGQQEHEQVVLLQPHSRTSSLPGTAKQSPQGGPGVHPPPPNMQIGNNMNSIAIPGPGGGGPIPIPRGVLVPAPPPGASISNGSPNGISVNNVRVAPNGGAPIGGGSGTTRSTTSPTVSVQLQQQNADALRRTPLTTQEEVAREFLAPTPAQGLARFADAKRAMDRIQSHHKPTPASPDASTMAAALPAGTGGGGGGGGGGGKNQLFQ